MKVILLIRIQIILQAFSTSYSITLARSITLGENHSHVLTIPKAIRVAVGNSKIVRVKAIPPEEILLKAIRAGRTNIVVWTRDGKRLLYEIKVLESGLNASLHGENVDLVVKVSIEFLELNMALSNRAGVHWPEAIKFSANAIKHGGNNLSGLNYTVVFSSAEGFVSHLLSEGWAKRIAHPEVHVRLGQEARFHSGGEVPILTSQENYGRYLRRIEWKPFGITIRVRPQSVDELHFFSDIKLEVSEPNLAGGVDGIPALQRRNIETKMISLDGETVILSGLVKQGIGMTRDSVPILSKIPILGNFLFSNSREQTDETEMLVGITISVSNPGRERAQMEELRERIYNDSLLK